MVIKTIAVLVILLALATRIPAVFWPKKAKNWLKELTKTNRDLNYILSFILLATGLIISSLAVRLVNLETFIVSAFGFALLVGSFVVYNDMHKDMIKIVLKKQDKWVQKVSLLKVAIALVLLWILMY